MDLIGDSTIHRLADGVARPTYDRAALRPRLAHVGVGAFHRCHQAEYLDDLAQSHASDWGIVGINITDPDVLPALGRQDGLYTRVLRDGAVDDTRVIGSIIATVPAKESGAVKALAAPEVDIVSFTVTEKGYCHVPATGEPDREHPDLVHDLEHPTADPRSVPGLVAAALDLRRQDATGGVTLVSCDNVPANGAVLERMVREVASARSADLTNWIDDNVGFVTTMVDRIVPATEPGEARRISERIGLEDRVPVVGEPFRQWVVSDGFRGPRPELEAVGVTITADVVPYEILKMRMVNGAQSMLAYLGALGGIEFICEAIAVAELKRLVERQLVDEVQPGLPAVDLDVDRYRRRLIARLANPAIHHTSHQIATDGSRKIVPRFVAPIASARAAGRSIEVLGLGVAAWIRYQAGVDDEGRPFEVRDPANPRIAPMVDRSTGDSRSLVAEVLADESIFGSTGRDPSVVDTVARHYETLQDRGAMAAVEALVTGAGTYGGGT